MFDVEKDFQDFLTSQGKDIKNFDEDAILGEISAYAEWQKDAFEQGLISKSDLDAVMTWKNNRK